MRQDHDVEMSTSTGAQGREHHLLARIWSAADGASGVDQHQAPVGQVDQGGVALPHVQRRDSQPPELAPKSGKLESITVHPDTLKVRPYISGAILRNIKFTQQSYDSFISLQDKLHQNLARQRTLVAIGTHDLDTIEGPFTYEALPPKEISFVPLNQTKKMNGEEMMIASHARPKSSTV